MNVDDVLELNADQNLAATSAPASPVPAVASHNYDFREGDAYGYIAAISDEERAKGKGAGDVLMYRYAGFKDGLHRLEHLAADGSVMFRSECPEPCVAIKIQGRHGVSRMAYSANSVLGAAYQDAMNGKLRPYRFAPPPEPSGERVDREMVDVLPPPLVIEPQPDPGGNSTTM